MTRGRQLIGACKDHVLQTMEALPECQPKLGKGAGYRMIEEAAELDLDLPRQNGYLTWSLLWSLAEEGKIEVVPGTENRRKYRLL